MISWNAKLGVRVGITATSVFFTGAVLAQPSALEHTLEVSVGQSGFAGVTGTVYQVEPDGTWTKSNFVNEARTAPIAEGEVGPDRLLELAGMVLESDLLSDASEAPPVNPTLIEVRYGNETWTVALPAGDLLDGCDAAADKKGCGVLSLAQWLQSEFGGSE